MCGIIAYIGNKNPIPILLDGLKRLEYRGYDSAGIAAVANGKFKVKKAVGKVAKLENEIYPLAKGGRFVVSIEDAGYSSGAGIGHTRWATHGKPSLANAHPHCSCNKKIWLVHNGIIENHKELKEWLVDRGHRFNSETDTETVVHLVEHFFRGAKNFKEAVRLALQKIHGAYALAILKSDNPRQLIVAKNSSPLVIGVGRGEFFVASDASAILTHTNKVIYLQDKELGLIAPDGYYIESIGGRPLNKKIEILAESPESVQKGRFSHFMLKEIFEEPDAVENAIRGRLILADGTAKLGGLETVDGELSKIGQLKITACGTAFLAGQVGEYMFEELAGIPTKAEYASEFRYKNSNFDKNTALLAISQSGETADTLAAVAEAKRKNILPLGIVNVVGSSVARQTKAGVYNHAGPEIGVASTKVFVSQLAVLALMALYLGRQRNLSPSDGRKLVRELEKIPAKMRTILSRAQVIKKLAHKYYRHSNFLYLGRKYNMPIAYEGALKLKEISYIHAEGYGAGEMKHGPIAMVDKNFPSVVIAPTNSVYEKIESNIEEIKARNGRILAIATVGNKKIAKLADDVFYIPPTLEPFEPMLSVVPLHLFAYYVGVMRGYDVDKPRNLAKSVTVE